MCLPARVRRAVGGQTRAGLVLLRAGDRDLADAVVAVARLRDSACLCLQLPFTHGETIENLLNMLDKTLSCHQVLDEDLRRVSPTASGEVHCLDHGVEQITLPLAVESQRLQL